MSAAHWHLILNHIPFLGVAFGTGLLAYGLWRAQPDVQRSSLGLIFVAGLTAIAVYLTGEPAEAVVEGLAGVSHDAIEAHEEFALFALIFSLITSVGALGTLIYERARGRLVRWTTTTVLVLGLITVGLLGYTANLGGQVSHPELRGATTAAEHQEAPASSPTDAEVETHDEDGE